MLLLNTMLTSEMTPHRPIFTATGARPSGRGLSKYWAKQLLSEYRRLPVLLPGPSLV